MRLIVHPAALILGALLVPARTAHPQAAADTTPVAVVQRQFVAYNAHDVEAFLNPYAEDAVLRMIDGPDSTAVRGHEAIRRTYAFLRHVPREFRVELVKRIASGPFVIDQERVHGAKPLPAFDPIAIYEVRGGLIRNVWFAQPK
jgi:hypothetical protein